MKRLACALVLAGSACALTGVQYEADASPARATDKLLLSILTPDPASIGDRVSLDVSYRGSAVDVVELYVDSALVAQRHINTAQTRGIHWCDLCLESDEDPDETHPVNGTALTLGSAEVRVLTPEGVWLAAPDLVYHYVARHNYLPPEPFIEAVLASRIAPEYNDDEA